jgi:hypothetical protein
LPHAALPDDTEVLADEQGLNGEEVDGGAEEGANRCGADLVDRVDAQQESDGRGNCIQRGWLGKKEQITRLNEKQVEKIELRCNMKRERATKSS